MTQVRANKLSGSLRGKALVVMALVALVPAVLLGGLGAAAVRGLAGLARDRARAAVEQEASQRLLSRAEEQARADDALFEGVRAQAVTLARYVAWYYDHPQNLPEPGYLKGGSPLEQTAEGHRVNRPDTPVGVFVSRRARMTDDVWREVGTLSFADPLLKSIRESTPGAARTWVISATRILRMYPNLRLGHRGSPVGPDYDLTEDEPFQAAAPARNPARAPVWTAPYADPATHRLMITAAVPIYGADGRFRAVAGVDMLLTDVVERVLQSQVEPGSYAFLLDREGRVVSAPEAAWVDFGLSAGGQPLPGRIAATSLRDSPVGGVRGLATRLRGAQAPGLASFDVAAGRRYIGFAPLPATGWVLGWSAPAAAIEGAATDVQAGILRLERLFLAGGAAGLLLTLIVVAGLATRAAAALARPVAALVDGTRRLAADLSYRLPELGQDELGRLAIAFNAMATSLERSRAEAVRNARMVVAERNRLARDIHDTIAQGLAGVVVHLETAEDILGASASPDATKHLRQARELAREGLREARRSVWNLRPSTVEEGGLAGALRTLADGLQSDGVACHVQIDSVPDVPPAVEDALFRVCQEALTNARRYSGAWSVRLTLVAADGRVVLQVSDDGRGFDPSSLTGPRPGGGFGLWAMRERLADVGGELSVESRPGAGTTITARVPLKGE